MNGTIFVVKKSIHKQNTMPRKKESIITLETLGQVIKESREGKGIKQSDLAKEVGISEVTLRSIENNYTTSPSIEKFIKICNALDLKIIVR